MKETLESCLTNEKVYVKFYKRKKGNSTIDNPKHVAHGGMLETATKTYVLPRLRSGQMKNILTDSEKEYLEDIMRLQSGDLSIYNKGFWGKRSVTLRKENNTFDLSDPDQYINYKILLANTNAIAPSLEAAETKRTYLFYIEREGEDIVRKGAKISTNQKAYTLYGKYESNKEILRYILKQAGKPTAKNTKIETITGWISELIDNKAKLFVEIASDKFLKTKVFINLAVDLGILVIRDEEYFDGDTGKAIAEDGKPSVLENAAIYLNKPRYQEYKLALEAKVKNNS